MYKLFFLFIHFLVFILQPIRAQQAGRICFEDSAVLEIRDFTILRTELHYYRNNGNFRNTENTTVDFMREYSPEKICFITFKYEKGRGADKFYYLLQVEGISSDGSSYKRKIKTWDWLEMSTHGPGKGRNTEIIFFTEKKKLDIVKIEFY